MPHLLVDHGWLDTEKGEGGTAWLGWPHTRQGCHHVPSSLRLPVGVDHTALALPNHLQSSSRVTSSMALSPIQAL